MASLMGSRSLALEVTSLYLVGGDVHATAVHHDVTMANSLTSLLAGAGEAKAVHDVIQTALKQAHQVVTGDTLGLLGLAEVAAELLLENAVDELGLLLLAKLDAILALLAPTTLRLAMRFLVDAHDNGVDAELATPLEDRGPIDCHCYCPSLLHATTLARTATVVRNGGLVLDARNLETGGLQGANGGLASGTGALHEYGHPAKSMLHGSFCTSLSRNLSRKGCGLARALEADGTTRLPGNDVTRRIGDGDDRC